MLVLVVLGLGIGAFVLGRATSPATAQGEGHGEVPLHRGVPVAVRHSVAGSATAAVNYQIAATRVSVGTLDAGGAAEVLLGANASEEVRRTLQPPTAPSEALRQQRSSFAPLSIVVQSYDGQRAVVQVWGVLASSSRVVPTPAGRAGWGRTTVTLEWRSSSWKVVDQQYREGPWPARQGERFDTADGEFVFRYDEIVGGAWAYVPEP
ncbi:hypothetical protein [Longimycelium tulufanense]|uniref:hypothetical protein n=1 Tax=Longimycelium tulufanense TaxID=907463 RepID=UPI001662C6F3|nr:hypothetical protein [Longimycelium tulufanense]